MALFLSQRLLYLHSPPFSQPMAGHSHFLLSCPPSHIYKPESYPASLSAASWASCAALAMLKLSFLRAFTTSLYAGRSSEVATTLVNTSFRPLSPLPRPVPG